MINHMSYLCLLSISVVFQLDAVPLQVCGILVQDYASANIQEVHKHNKAGYVAKPLKSDLSSIIRHTACTQVSNMSSWSKYNDGPWSKADRCMLKQILILQATPKVHSRIGFLSYTLHLPYHQTRYMIENTNESDYNNNLCGVFVTQGEIRNESIFVTENISLEWVSMSIVLCRWRIVIYKLNFVHSTTKMF